MCSGSDSVVHICKSPAISTVSKNSLIVSVAEEVEDAGLVVPRCMWWRSDPIFPKIEIDERLTKINSYVLNVILGIAMLITMLFCIGSLDSALSSPAPYLQLFDNTGKTGVSLLLNVILFLLIFSGNITALATCSREVWAFARDKGFPFSKWISHVSSMFSQWFRIGMLISKFLLDELEVQYSFQLGLPNLRPHRCTLPHQPWLDPCLQHHYLALPLGSLVYLHDLDRMRTAPPVERPGTAPSALEPWQAGTACQYVRLLLCRFCLGFLLFSGLCAG
jgi:hypothetical protein